jgi:hypothetical protein
MMEWNDCKLFASTKIVDWSYELPDTVTSDVKFESAALMLLKDDMTSESYEIKFNDDHSCFGVSNVNMWNANIKPLYLGNVYGTYDENSPLEDDKCITYCLN